MKKIWITTLFLLCPFAATSQELPKAKLHGQVFDAFGEPINRAFVTIRLSDGKTYNRTTNAEGYYTFAELPAGKIDVRVEAQGFVSLKKEISLYWDQTLLLDLPLEVGWVTEPAEMNVSGSVLHAGKAVVADARIAVLNPFTQQVIARTLSDKNGTYQLELPRRGQCILIVYKANFEVFSQTLSFWNDQTVNVELKAQKK